MKHTFLLFTTVNIYVSGRVELIQTLKPAAHEHPGSAAGRLLHAAHVGSAREPRVRINSARIWPRTAMRQISVVFNLFGWCIQRRTLVASCARVGRCALRSSTTLANDKA